MYAVTLRVPPTTGTCARWRVPQRRITTTEL